LNFLENTDGQDLVEYALIVAAVGLVWVSTVTGIRLPSRAGMAASAANMAFRGSPDSKSEFVW